MSFKRKYASEEYVDEKMKQVNVEVDATLSIEGEAADSKAVGDAISQKAQVQIITWGADD